MSLLDRLKTYRAHAIADKLHPGELTTEQWAEKWGLDLTSARKYLKEGVKSGMVLTRMARVLGKQGLVRRAQVWREKRRG